MEKIEKEVWVDETQLIKLLDNQIVQMNKSNSVQIIHFPKITADSISSTVSFGKFEQNKHPLVMIQNLPLPIIEIKTSPKEMKSITVDGETTKKYKLKVRALPVTSSIIPEELMEKLFSSYMSLLKDMYFVTEITK